LENYTYVHCMMVSALARARSRKDATGGGEGAGVGGEGEGVAAAARGHAFLEGAAEGFFLPLVNEEDIRRHEENIFYPGIFPCLPHGFSMSSHVFPMSSHVFPMSSHVFPMSSHVFPISFHAFPVTTGKKKGKICGFIWVGETVKKKLSIEIAWQVHIPQNAPRSRKKVTRYFDG
jgi:hypothetical protein